MFIIDMEKEISKLMKIQTTASTKYNYKLTCDYKFSKMK